jgi:L-threonylcarbamoyladenylate synthase
MDKITTAIQKLLKGNLVAFPTETVYGLGADCTDDKAVQKIFTTKGRPDFNPLIIHVANLETACKYGLFNDCALQLAKAFWPGPLTLVVPLNLKVKISSYVTAGLSTVAIRSPNHPVAMELLRHYPNPIAAPSANRSGYISPTKYEHVYDEFKDDVFIIPGDQSYIGLESTIVDCSTADITILRPGFITKFDIEAVLKCSIMEVSSATIIKSPGQLEHHYAPKLPVRLNVSEVLPQEALLNFGNNSLNAETMLNLSMSADLNEAAVNLFDFLRQIDKSNSNHITGIAVAPIPNGGIGAAINERLKRAAIKK